MAQRKQKYQIFFTPETAHEFAKVVKHVMIKWFGHDPHNYGVKGGAGHVWSDWLHITLVTTPDKAKEFACSVKKGGLVGGVLRFKPRPRVRLGINRSKTRILVQLDLLKDGAGGENIVDDDELLPVLRRLPDDPHITISKVGNGAGITGKCQSFTCFLNAVKHFPRTSDSHDGGRQYGKWPGEDEEDDDGNFIDFGAPQLPPLVIEGVRVEPPGGRNPRNATGLNIECRGSPEEKEQLKALVHERHEALQDEDEFQWTLERWRREKAAQHRAAAVQAATAAAAQHRAAAVQAATAAAAAAAAAAAEAAEAATAAEAAVQAEAAAEEVPRIPFPGIKKMKEDLRRIGKPVPDWMREKSELKHFYLTHFKPYGLASWVKRGGFRHRKSRKRGNRKTKRKKRKTRKRRKRRKTKRRRRRSTRRR